jgi:hypothetical protein
LSPLSGTYEKKLSVILTFSLLEQSVGKSRVDKPVMWLEALESIMQGSFELEEDAFKEIAKLPE